MKKINLPLMGSSKIVGVQKLAIWPYSALIYVNCEVFIFDADNVTWFNYAWKKIAHYKIDPNWIEAG